MDSFFKRLKIIRSEMNIGQKEMAEKTGVAFGTYRRYERGETSPPLEFLAQFVSFGYSLEWLINGTGSKEVPDYILNPGGPDPYHEDPGLEELLSPVNRGKFLITEDEAEELREISRRRKSDSTIENWVSLLYILRDMK